MKLKQELESKSDEAVRDDVLEFIECHDPNKYRKKIKGFHIAFSIREKIQNVPDDKGKYKFTAKQVPEEIKKQALELKSKREQEKQTKEKGEKEKYDKDREALRKLHEKLRKEKFG